MRAMRVGRPRYWLAVAVGAVAVTVSAVIFALFVGHDRPVNAMGRPPLATGPATPDPVASPSAEPASSQLSLSSTADPNVFARSIATSVFGIDTPAFAAAEYRRALRQAADPSLSDSGRADLFASVDARVPSDALWARMRANGQWSHWTPSRTWEPAAWSQVVTGGYAEPGWVMRNVAGIQTTHYLEGGAERSTARQQTLTVVMRCPTRGVRADRCGLVLVATQPVF